MSRLQTALEFVVLGNTVRDWVTAALVMVLMIMLARLFRSRIVALAKRFTGATKSDFDDQVLEGTVWPVSGLVVLGGFHFAVAILEMPAGLRSVIDRGLILAAALLLTMICLRAIDALFQEVVRPWAHRFNGHVDEQLLRFGRVVLKIVVVLVFAVMVLERVGLNVMSLVTGLGIGGMAVALAAQETLGNVLGSLQIMTDRPFTAGDWVRVEGHMGIVQEIGLRSTKILTRGRILVVIPNKSIAEAVIQNLSVGGDLAVELALGLTYDTSADSMRRAIDLLHEILATQDGVASDPLVHFVEYGDFNLVIRCCYYVGDLRGYWDVQNDVNLEIKRRFDEEGLDFAFPTQTIHLAK